MLIYRLAVEQSTCQKHLPLQRATHNAAALSVNSTDYLRVCFTAQKRSQSSCNGQHVSCGAWGHTFKEPACFVVGVGFWDAVLGAVQAVQRLLYAAMLLYERQRPARTNACITIAHVTAQSGGSDPAADDHHATLRVVAAISSGCGGDRQTGSARHPAVVLQESAPLICPQ